VLTKPIKIDWRTNLGLDTYEEEVIESEESATEAAELPSNASFSASVRRRKEKVL